METFDFGKSYLRHRRDFRSAAEMVGAKVEHHAHPAEKAADGSPLHVTVARVGAVDAKKLLIVSSGTHGAEGMIGSDIQRDFMLCGADEKMPDDQAILYVHALNPYGFSHGRRVNEDNVDLNRNFIDWGMAAPASHRLTDRVTDLFQPQDWRWPHLKVAGMIFWHGLPTMQKAVSQGQYTRKDGLFYGGDKPAWSNIVWNRILAAHTASAETIVHVDIHTGLGEHGASEIIIEEPEGSPAYERARRLWWHVSSTRDGSSVSACVSGDICSAFNRASGKATVTSVALEFGTQSGIRVLRALAMDNWVEQRGLAETMLGHEAKQRMREAFYPPAPGWRKATRARGCEVLTQALCKL